MEMPSFVSRVSRAEREDSEQFKQLVSFRIGQEEFGVDILVVQEIIRLPTITPLPNSQRFILGMINLRGKIIPVIDLRRRLKIRGGKSSVSDRKARVLIVEMQSSVTGFIVDSVSEVMRIPANEIEPTPHLVVSNIDSEYIKGVIKLPNRLVILLDFQQILKPREVKEIQSARIHALEGDIRGANTAIESLFETT